MSKHDFLKKELEKKGNEEYNNFLRKLNEFLKSNDFPEIVYYDNSSKVFVFNNTFVLEYPYLREYFIEDYSKKMIEKIEQNIGIVNKNP